MVNPPLVPEVIKRLLFYLPEIVGKVMGGFNVPQGSYVKPQICNTQNLKAVSQLLKKVVILNGDFTETIEYATNESLFYFDPPYKPVSATSSFNSYSNKEFDDNEQIRKTILR